MNFLRKIAEAARRNPWFIATVVLPVFLSAIYYFGIASPQYVSEARFVVRSRADAPQLSLGSMISAAAGASAGPTAEANSVRDFLLSHDAVMRTQERVDLISMWSRPDADFYARLTATESDSGPET